MRPLPRFVLLAAALTTAVALLPAAVSAEGSAPPGDYIAMADELSQPIYGPDDIVTVTHHLELHDGETKHLQITMPDPERFDGPDGQGFPVILKSSPYNGTLAPNRNGARIFPDPRNENGNPIGLNGYFPPRGYAVVHADLRGTGRSTGCLDHLGPNDAKDLKTVIEWLADAEWSNGNIGMTGHSYVGSTPAVAAAQNPRGLKTIVPSAGLASMYDHQFHHGVKWFLQWAGPQWTYAALTVTREAPVAVNTFALGHTGDNWPTSKPEQIGCGFTTSAYTAGHGQATGQYQAWHAQRDWRAGAMAADIPIFMIHGVNDNAARIPAAEWFFAGRAGRDGDKVWLSQHDHGSAGVTTCPHADNATGHPNCRMDQWKYGLHAWFDKHLMERDIDTGPPVEVFLNGEKVHTADRWEVPSDFLTLYPDASDMSLRLTPPDGSSSQSWQAHGRQQFDFSQGYHAAGTAVEFASEPFEEDVVFVGPPPKLRLNASIAGPATNLVAVLYREGADGRDPVNHCAIQPTLRHGVSTPAPVVPGQEMELDLQCFTIAHHLQAGERLVLSLRTWSNHHVSDLANDPNVTVYTGPDATRYTLPIAPDALVHEDVPLRE